MPVLRRPVPLLWYLVCIMLAPLLAACQARSAPAATATVPAAGGAAATRSEPTAALGLPASVTPASYPGLLAATATPLPEGYPSGGSTQPPTEAPVTAPPAQTVEPTVASGSAFIIYNDSGIEPATTTATVGTTVTFIIRGGPHQPYSDTAPHVFEAPAGLGDNSIFTYVFTEAGTTTLLCGYHPEMRATINLVP